MRFKAHTLAFAAATLVLGSAVAPATAWAGGIGVMAMGGTHTDRLWFHSNVLSDEGEAVLLENPNEFPKYEVVETRPNTGLGLELIMGDRDDRILGSFRFFYMIDAAQIDPIDITDEVSGKKLCDKLGADAPEGCDADTVLIRAFREDPRKIGMGMVGLSWGVIGNPDSFQLGLVGHIGSGFLTNDHTEFLAVNIGPGVTYKFARQMQAFADAGYMMRYRRGFSHGTHLTGGVRYLFD